jgi:hypothetical protein
MACCCGFIQIIERGIHERALEDTIIQLRVLTWQAGHAARHAIQDLAHVPQQRLCAGTWHVHMGNTHWAGRICTQAPHVYHIAACSSPVSRGKSSGTCMQQMQATVCEVR